MLLNDIFCPLKSLTVDTSWYGEVPIIYRVLHIPSGAGLLPSTVFLYFLGIFTFSIISGVFWSQPEKKVRFVVWISWKTPARLQRAARRIPGLELWLSGATRQGHPFCGWRCWFGPMDGTMADQNGWCTVRTKKITGVFRPAGASKVTSLPPIMPCFFSWKMGVSPILIRLHSS